MSSHALVPDLPDDIVLLCLARVPRVYHSKLCQVCKSWRSLLRSPLFISTRAKLNVAQQFLYMLVRTHGSCFKWFVLNQHRNLKQLSPLPLMPCSATGAACAVLDAKLFVLGGCVNGIPSRNVWVFDACYNKWELGPSMRVAREFAAAGVINGKIYVVGGCPTNTWARWTSWAEVFDPCLGSWAPVPSPIEIREKWMHGNAVLGEKLLAMADRGGVVYDPNTSAWSYVSIELDLGWRGRATVVDGILYCYDYLGKIRGYDPGDNRWMELQGVDQRLPKFLCGATLANVGGKLYVVWENMANSKETELLCAEVEVYKDNSCGLQGSVLWSDVILGALPRGTSIVHCLSIGF